MVKIWRKKWKWNGHTPTLRIDRHSDKGWSCCCALSCDWRWRRLIHTCVLILTLKQTSREWETQVGQVHFHTFSRRSVSERREPLKETTCSSHPSWITGETSERILISSFIRPLDIFFITFAIDQLFWIFFFLFISPRCLSTLMHSRFACATAAAVTATVSLEEGLLSLFGEKCGQITWHLQQGSKKKKRASKSE